MSNSMDVANAELAQALKDNEDRILSVTKSKTVNLSEEMFERCLISDSMMDQFSSLDHSRVEPQLQLRYLLRLVTQRIQQDGSVWEKFLGLLKSWGEHCLCEYLRSYSTGEALPTDTNVNLNRLLCTDEISWIFETLVKVSHSWDLLATALGLPPHEIENSRERDNKRSLRNVLLVWLSTVNTTCTIEKLIQTLKSEVVGQSKLADELQEKFKSIEESKLILSNKIHCSAFTITRQTRRIVEVEDGKSTLLRVQASQRENVSYQWNKNGQLLADHISLYSGVHDDILVISHTHQGAVGEYQCCVKYQEREVVSNKMTLTVLYSPNKKTLLDLYSINSQVPRDDPWPPVGTKTFINLVLIKSKDNPEDNARYSLSADIDGLLMNKEKIKFEDAFTQYKTGALILIEGRPGSGKTTLVHKIINDWKEGNILVQARLVFLVCLSTISNKFSEESTLCSILQQYYSNIEDLKSVISDIEKSNGKGVCFVFDGLDEYYPCDESKSVIFQLLNKLYLSLAMFIVTSRPGAMARLRQKAVTQQVEIFGFTEDQISEYIDTFPFGNLPDCCCEPAKVKKYLSSHPNLFEMCYLPIHAAIICFVYKTGGGILPNTQTKIYEEFTRTMLLRHLMRKGKAMQLSSLKNLPDSEKDNFRKLCKLAFTMTFKIQYVVNKDKISFLSGEDGHFSDDWSLSLISCNVTAQLCGILASYTFLHRTLQEFLAAYYIASTEGEQKRILIEKVSSRLWCRRYTTMLTFYFGLEELDSGIELSIYHDILRDTFHLMGDYGIAYAFESQQKILCDEILKLSDGQIELTCLIFYDVIPLVYMICTTSEPIKRLNLTFNTDYEMNYVLKRIQYIKFPELQELRIPRNIIGNFDTLQYLLNILESCVQLQDISLRCCMLKTEGEEYFADKLKHLTHLEYLSLRYAFNILDCSVTQLKYEREEFKAERSFGLLEIINQVHCHRQLKLLDFSGFKMDIKCCEYLAKNIIHLTNLESVSLMKNRINSEALLILSSGIFHLPKLEVLDLCDNTISVDGALGLASGLHHLTSLKDLCLSGNGLDAQGVIRIIAALKDCQRMV